MGVGIEIYAPDGSLQLNSSSKVIAAPQQYVTITGDLLETAGKAAYEDPELRVAPGTFPQIRRSTTPLPDINKSFFGFSPYEGKHVIVNNAYNLYTSPTANPEPFATVMFMSGEFVHPTNSQGLSGHLSVYDSLGNAMWNTAAFTSVPHVVDFVEIPLDRTKSSSQLPVMYYDLPTDLDLNKIFIMPLFNKFLWYSTRHEGGAYLEESYSFKRVGRRLYVFPQEAKGDRNSVYYISVGNGSRTRPLQEFTENLFVVRFLLLYLHDAP